MNNKELLPCPFCGDKAGYHVSGLKGYVYCTGCGVTTDGSYTQEPDWAEEETRFWNQRVYPPEVQNAIEKQKPKKLKKDTNTKYGATVDTFLGDVDSSGVLQTPSAQTDLVFAGVTDLADFALHYKFYYNPTISSASFPQLVQVSGLDAMRCCFQNTSLENISFPVLQSATGARAFYNAFYGTSIQSVSFPALITVSGDSCFSGAFSNCGEITSASFPALEEITGGVAFSACFASCSALTNVSFPKLKKIGSDTTTVANDRHFDGAFRSTKVTSLEFPELTAIYCTGNLSSWGTFNGNGTIQKMYFPKLTVIDKSPAYTGSTKAQNYIFSGCNSLTEIHFGAANQAAIEATEGYSTLWGRGAGNATVYFDL